MNDTLRIANDSLNIVLSSSNAVAQESSEITANDVAYILCILAILIVIAAGIYYTLRMILSAIKKSREMSLQHEERMLELNRTKEERKNLLDFCYEMAKKKESATKDFFKETTITETTKTSTKGTSSGKETKQTTDSSTNIKSAENENARTTESSNNGTSADKEDTSSCVVNTTTKENKEVEHIDGTITLDQIRQECWLIIKKMNDVNDLK